MATLLSQQRIELLPSMDDRRSVDFGNPPEDTVPQLLPRLHAYMPQERSRHFAKKRFHDVQPRTVGGREDVLEAVRTSGQISLGLLGKVGRVIVQNQAQGALGRIIMVQVLQQGDKLPTAVAVLHPRSHARCADPERPKWR